MKWWRVVLLAGALTVVTLLCVVVSASLLRWRSGETVVGVDLLAKQLGVDLPNRIAVLEMDGNIATIAPDGSAHAAITTDASEQRVYRYPTWAPGGATLAFVELSFEGEMVVESALRFSSATGRALSRVPTEYPPFYLFWSPTGDSIAFLSSWATGTLALRMVDVAGGISEPETLSQGNPFYFSWGPAGERLFAHIGADELALLNRMGASEALQWNAGSFQAPHWSPDGTRLAFAVERDGENALAVTHPEVGALVEITKRPGFLAFNWNPDSHRIAYSFTQGLRGLPSFGPLWVHDVESHHAWEISKEPVLAFFWSPDGKRLAFLRPAAVPPSRRAPRTASFQQQIEVWLRWHIWDGERTYPLVRFSPTQTFLLEYLRFFDQYAQSSSLWSPDSQQLLYAGLSESGLSGIWTVPANEGSAARRVATGVMATWSPR